MKPTIIILSGLLAALTSCTSVSMTSASGEAVHIQNSFGRASIASVTTPGGLRVEGFQSDHTEVTKDAAKKWFSFRLWRAIWTGPIGQGAGDVLSSSGEAIQNATN